MSSPSSPEPVPAAIPVSPADVVSPASRDRRQRHVLVLGGTSEGRRLAEALLAQTPGAETLSIESPSTEIPGAEASPDGALPGGAVPGVSAIRVTSSLAGRVSRPLMPPGEVRVGGFRGVEGLVHWLLDHHVDAVVDATHPYAATMTTHAAQACSRADVPLLRLDRPAWSPDPGDDWHIVESIAAAAAMVDQLGERAFLTTGRLEAAGFADVRAWCLLRSIEPPDPPLPARHTLLLDRGPFDLDRERATLRQWEIDVLVTKNSGGPATAPKLTAARELGIPVIVVERPAPPPGLTVVHTVAEAASWVRDTIGGQ